MRLVSKTACIAVSSHLGDLQSKFVACAETRSCLCKGPPEFGYGDQFMGPSTRAQFLPRKSVCFMIDFISNCIINTTNSRTTFDSAWERRGGCARIGRQGDMWFFISFRKSHLWGSQNHPIKWTFRPTPRKPSAAHSLVAPLCIQMCARSVLSCHPPRLCACQCALDRECAFV